jgi:ATP-dependent protease ClpP protease subunit
MSILETIRSGGGLMQNDNVKHNVTLEYTEDLCYVKIEISSPGGTELTGQDITDAVCGVILEHWTNYDLDTPPRLDS